MAQTIRWPGHDPAVDEDRFVTLIDHLERRRAVNDQAMWLAPALVVAGQAFLLQVLSDGGLGTRWVVLAAAIAVNLAALLALLRGRAREVEHSEAIAHYADQARLPELRPPLPRKDPPHPSPWRPIEQRIHRLVTWRWVPAPIYAWAGTLLVFIAADIAVYCAA